MNQKMHEKYFPLSNMGTNLVVKPMSVLLSCESSRSVANEAEEKETK
jgi:hypothetical protein